MKNYCWLFFIATNFSNPLLAAESFSGFYVSGGVGLKKTRVEEVVSSKGVASISSGDSSYVGRIAGGYSFEDGARRLALGGFIDVGDGKVAIGPVTVAGLAGTYSFKGTRHYGISMEPGYALLPNTVGYAKLMYNWFNGAETLTGTTNASGSNTFNAFGYGLGIKSIVSNNIFVFAEWQRAQYKTASFAAGAARVQFQPNDSIGLVGIGKHF